MPGLAPVAAEVGPRAEEHTGARDDRRAPQLAGPRAGVRAQELAGARVGTAPLSPVPLLPPRLLHAAPPPQLLHAAPPRVLRRRRRLGFSPARIWSSLERIGAGRRRTGSELGGLPPRPGLRCAAVAWACRDGELQLYWLSAEQGGVDLRPSARGGGRGPSSISIPLSPAVGARALRLERRRSAARAQRAVAPSSGGEEPAGAGLGQQPRGRGARPATGRWSPDGRPWSPAIFWCGNRRVR